VHGTRCCSRAWIRWSPDAVLGSLPLPPDRTGQCTHFVLEVSGARRTSPLPSIAPRLLKVRLSKSRRSTGYLTIGWSHWLADVLFVGMQLAKTDNYTHTYPANHWTWAAGKNSREWVSTEAALAGIHASEPVECLTTQRPRRLGCRLQSAQAGGLGDLGVRDKTLMRPRWVPPAQPQQRQSCETTDRPVLPAPVRSVSAKRIVGQRRTRSVAGKPARSWSPSLVWLQSNGCVRSGRLVLGPFNPQQKW